MCGEGTGCVGVAGTVPAAGSEGACTCWEVASGDGGTHADRLSATVPVFPSLHLLCVCVASLAHIHATHVRGYAVLPGVDFRRHALSVLWISPESPSVTPYGNKANFTNRCVIFLLCSCWLRAFALSALIAVRTVIQTYCSIHQSRATRPCPTAPTFAASVELRAWFQHSVSASEHRGRLALQATCTSMPRVRLC